MRSLLSTAGVAALVAVTAGSAAAGQEAMTLDKKVLSLAAARKIVAASEADAKARGSASSSSSSTTRVTSSSSRGWTAPRWRA